MRKKFYVGALAMAMASLVAIGASNVEADAAAATAKVEYTCGSDYTETLEVVDGSAATTTAAKDAAAPYMFYTTTAVTTTIPANSKWMKIPKNGDGKYTLDVSSYNARTIFFFAQSPNPDSVDDVLKVVLPAKPTLTGLAYNAAAEADKEGQIDEAMFTLNKAKVGGAAFSAAKLTGYAADKADKAIEAAMPKLEEVRDTLSSQSGDKTYSVVYYNNADKSLAYAAEPKAPDTKAKEYCSRYEIATADEKDGKWLRPSVPFALKVTKPAAAPSLTIDYANHTMTLKKDMQYVSALDFDDVEMGKGQWVSTDAVTTITDAKGSTDPLEAGQKYAIVTVTKGRKSVPAYLSVPAVEGFLDAGGRVSVEGTLIEKDADKVILHLGAAGAGDMTYQYKIVDADDVDSFIDDDGVYKYTAKEVWTTVAVKNTKDVTIAGKLLKGGKSILVRVMAGKTAFSSNVAVLNQPEDSGDGWKMHVAEDADTEIENATRGKAQYDPKNTKIIIPFTGIKNMVEAPAGEGATDSRAKITLLAGGITTDVDNSKVKWENSALTIDMKGDTKFEALDGSKPVTVNIPTGWLIDQLDNVLPAQTITGINVDNVAPKITSVAMTKDKAGNAILTVTIDSAVKVKQSADADEDAEFVEAGAEVGIDVSEDDYKIVTVTPMEKIGDNGAAATNDNKEALAAIESATLKLSSGKSIITLTLAQMPTIADMIAGYEVTLTNVTDLVGNAFAANTNIATAENKVAYNKDAKKATLKVDVSELSGGKVTVTVTSDKTLDVKNLTALKKAITSASEDYKISGVTWKQQNKIFTFTISGLSPSANGTVATINADSIDDDLIKDAEGFVLDAKDVKIEGSSEDSGDEGGES